MNCDKDHSDLNDIFKILTYEQGGDGRHKCCGCAYELGFKNGFNNTLSSIDQIPYSQSGLGRHKSITEAYHMGMKQGMINRKI